MWVVKTINSDEIIEVVNSLQNIYEMNGKDIVLTLSSNLGFTETYLCLYEIIKLSIAKGISVKRGPLISGDVVLANKNAFKLNNIALEDIVWWLVHNNMLDESFESVLLEDKLITIDNFVLKRG